MLARLYFSYMYSLTITYILILLFFLLQHVYNMSLRYTTFHITERFVKNVIKVQIWTITSVKMTKNIHVKYVEKSIQNREIWPFICKKTMAVLKKHISAKFAKKVLEATNCWKITNIKRIAKWLVHSVLKFFLTEWNYENIRQGPL